MTKRPPNQDECECPDKLDIEVSDAMVIKLAEEQIEFSKEKFIEGRVTVTRKTSHREEIIDELLTQELVEVERIQKGERIDALPEIREENGVLIIPVVDEEIEVIRTLVLREEVHIRKVKKSRSFQESVDLRSQGVIIERNEEDL